MLDAMASASTVLMSAIVLGELDAGFRLGTHERMNRLALEEFLDEPFVTVLPVTRDVSNAYGKILAELRKKGRPIPTNDIWIAASTVSQGATLVTLDSDFKNIRGLSHLIVRD